MSLVHPAVERGTAMEDSAECSHLCHGGCEFQLCLDGEPPVSPVGEVMESFGGGCVLGSERAVEFWVFSRRLVVETEMHVLGCDGMLTES